MCRRLSFTVTVAETTAMASLIVTAIILTVSGLSKSERLPSVTDAPMSNNRRLESPSSSTSGSPSLPSPTWSAVEEFCDWEMINITCPDDDHVLVIRNAQYGRLRLGRCVAKNYGHLGCGADVTSRLEADCSGRRRCRMSVISLHGTFTTCPSDLKAYVQLTYDCIKVSMPQRLSCSKQQSSAPVITFSSGLLASAMSRATDISSLPSSLPSLTSSSSSSSSMAGSPTCPWSLRAAEYQRISLTIIDFSLPTDARASSAKNDVTLPIGTPPIPCIKVAERSGTGNVSTLERTICGNGRDRETIAYKSKTNAVDIYIVNLRGGRHNQTGNEHEFLIRYGVFGCPPVVAPAGGHVISVDADKAMFRCNDSRDVIWTLTCRDSQWVAGDVTGTCHKTPAVASLNPDSGVSLDQSNDKDVLYGVMVIVSLGVAVGVTVGILMLVLVLLYQRRYRQRKINCRADSYLMKRALNSVDPPLINAHVAESRVPSPGDGITGCDESMVSPTNWTSHSNEFKPIQRENTPCDLDHMVTWSRAGGKQRPFPASGRCSPHPFDGHVIHHGGRMVPDGTSAYCSRHAVTVCRSVPAWRDGCTPGSHRHYAAIAGRRDGVTADARKLESSGCESTRQRDLWELCERYGLAECNGVGTLPHANVGAGHQFHTVCRQVSPVIGVKRLDLVNGVIDGSDDVTNRERVRFNSMTSPPAVRTAFSSSKVQRPASRRATTNHSLNTGGRNRLTFQTTEPLDDRSRTSTFDVPDGGVCVSQGPMRRVDISGTELQINVRDNEGGNDNGLMAPTANVAWKPPRERSPYYFKLDSETAVIPDRLPLVGGLAMTSERGQSEAIE